MEADCFVHFKFKNRKTGQFFDGYLAFTGTDKKDPALSKYFDIHDFKIVEKRLVDRETYDRWRREKRSTLISETE